jgi:hypothetical protein
MIEAELRAFLEGGRSLIVATVDAEGVPRAGRGWGLDVLDPVEERVRLLLPADDPVTTENLKSPARLAVTATDVVTLSSIQGKGHVLSVAPATSADRRRVDRYRDAFFADLERTDGTPRALFDRVVHRNYCACTAIIDQWYDQTPGPRAGSPTEGPAR